MEATEITFENSDCTLTTAETGTGFMNTASVTVNDVDVTDDDCQPPPAEPDVDKAVTSGPTPLGNGQYQITLRHHGHQPRRGHRRVRPRRRAQLRRRHHRDLGRRREHDAWHDHGQPGWDGGTDTVVVDDQPIEAATVAGPAMHVYTATVVVEAEADLTPEAADCDPATGNPNTGSGQHRHDHDQRRGP